MEAFTSFGSQTFGGAWPAVWSVVRIVVIVVPLLVCVAYLTLWERKLIGWMHIRLGPNRVGYGGLLQPWADAVKLIFKEVIAPSQADKPLFFLAPMLVMMPALAAWAVIPFGPGLVLADVNAGLLFVMAITSVGVYGVIIAGWASNSKYAFLGALRASAQMVSYEVVMGLAIVGALVFTGSLSMVEIINGQIHSGVWNVFYQPLGFFIFFVCGLAETNRTPFDLPEGESEIIGGFHTEYSGIRWSLFFLSEYTGMVIVASVASTL